MNVRSIFGSLVVHVATAHHQLKCVRRDVPINISSASINKKKKKESFFVSHVLVVQ